MKRVMGAWSTDGVSFQSAVLAFRHMWAVCDVRRMRVDSLAATRRDFKGCAAVSAFISLSFPAFDRCESVLSCCLRRRRRLIVLQRQKRHVRYVISQRARARARFVAPSVWRLGTVVCVLERLSSALLGGRVAACETSPWQIYDCLPSQQQKLSVTF